jgi:hypothetical protein
MGDTSNSGDILGIAPYGEAVNTVAKGTVAGAGAFLSRICLPAAEEFGLLLRDKVTAWRSVNATQILNNAERLLEAEHDASRMHAHPRLVGKILENGSWTDDDGVQRLWAGLLATACTADGTDESNLIFVNLLDQLTSAQVRILKAACTDTQKMVSLAGWIFASPLVCTLDLLREISGVQDANRLDRELDHLRTLGLIVETGGFQTHSPIPVADVTPSALALQLFARCNGHRGEPKDFYGAFEVKPVESNQQT